MTETRIHRFRALHHAGDAAAARRLAGVQQRLLEGELDAALAALVPDDGELVLVRRLVLPLALAPAGTEFDATRAWAQAIAVQLDRQLRGGSPAQVLRFRHRLAATLDFARAALHGDGSQDWAWRQLGWLPRTGAQGIDAPQRRQAWVDRLIGAGDELPPLLQSTHAAGLLAPTLDGLDGDDLRTLALRAWVAQGGAAEQAWRDEGAPAPLAEAAAGAGGLQVPMQGLAAAVPGTPPTGAAAADRRRVWRARVLALVLQPHRMRHGAAALDAWWQASGPQGGGNGSAPAAQSISPIDTPAALSGRPDGASDAAAPPMRATEAGLHDAPPPHASMAAGARPSPLDGAVRATSARVPRAPRTAEGRTDAGGLLLLLNLLPGCGALALLEDDTAWPESAWPWPAPLHRLATQAMALAADDPAALAFAGLGPRAVPPAPTRALEPAQRASLDAAWSRLTAAVRERLPQWPAADAVRRLAMRPARIVAEPGWLEVHFPLERAGLDIRRAALDLDPGWLPWLGTAVRFVYE